MEDIHKLRAELRSKKEEMHALINAAEAEDRDFTDAEEQEYQERKAEADKLQRRIDRLEEFRAQQYRTEPAKPEPREQTTTVEARDYDGTDFRSLAEFVQAAVLNPRDQRLRSQYTQQY